MSKAEMVSLGLIYMRPMHGYEIAGIIKMRDLENWAGVRMNAVYKALQRLEEKRCLIGNKEQEGNLPPRVVFTITDSGVALLKTLVKRFMFSDGRGDFWLAANFMYDFTSRDFFLAALAKQAESCSKALNHLDHVFQIVSDKPKEEIPFIVPSLIQMAIKFHEVMLSYLGEQEKGAHDPSNDIWFSKES